MSEVRIKPPVRVGDFERGKQAALNEVLEYLTFMGIIRESLFGDSLVAKMVETPENDVWPILDIDKNLGVKL